MARVRITSLINDTEEEQLGMSPLACSAQVKVTIEIGIVDIRVNLGSWGTPVPLSSSLNSPSSSPGL